MDWLTTSGGCEIEKEDDRSVSVTCRQNQERLKIVAAPDCNELIVKPHRPFSLEAHDDVEIADNFRLVIIPQASRIGTCTIRAPIMRIRCDPVVEYPTARGPALGLVHSADVEITGGNWSLGPAHGTERVPVNVVAASNDIPVRLTCDLPIGSLMSTGDHAFDLRWTENTAIEIAGGAPTFEAALRRVSLSGHGEVVANGGVAESAIDLSGSLTANGDVTSTAIGIDGNLKVTGSVVLGTEELTCGTAHIGGNLESQGEVKTDSLTVEAGIVGTSEIHTHDLNCVGPLSARKVTVTGKTKIHGDARCDEMRCEGDVDLRGAMAELKFLRWVVADGESRLNLQHPADEMASSYMPMPEVLVEERGKGTAAPMLDFGLNIGGIERLRVDVPRISFSVDSIPQGADFGFAEEVSPHVGLTLERSNVEISLQSGVLLCPLPAGPQPPLSANCTKGSALALRELNGHLPDLCVQGGGRVSVENPGPDASLGKVRVVGRTTFACAAPISKLRMETAALSDEGARLPATARTVPKINITADVVVREASGGCLLEHLGARIRGVERPRKRHGTSQFAVYDIIKTPDAADSTGHLTDVDVSHLDADKVDYLTAPRVLEISGRTVRRSARERTVLRCLLAQMMRVLGDC